jgi:alpha-glucosidase (family GH31 glycosyl hydrolase)
MKHTFLIQAFILFFIQITQAQIVSITPEDADTDSDVIIRYNAALGNAELAGYTGDVYAYTGVITEESQSNTDWKHVRNNWNEINPNTLMTDLGNDMYEISFNIRDFYEIQPDEKVLKLAFLFHNADYSLVGRTAEGGDIFFTINKELPGNYLSHELQNEKLSIQSENGSFEIQFYTPTTVKAEYIDTGSTLPDTSFTVIKKPETVNPQLTEREEGLSYSSSELEVYITKNPLRLHYIKNGDTLLSESEGFTKLAEGGSVGFKIDTDEAFYGGGSRAIPINRRGRNLKIYNEAHYGYSNNTPTLNISIPFFASNKSYGLFFDNRFPAYADIAAADNTTFKYTTEGGRLRYYFSAGYNSNEVLQEYTELTGKQKLPPLWALGYIQSKYGYENESDARQIVNQILSEDFPLDALILDLYWFGTTNDMGNLDWDYNLWPQPTEMMNDFSEKDIQTILITEPYFTLNSENYDELAANNYLAWEEETGDPFVLWGFWAGDAALLDISQTEAQDWMWDFYQARREEGVGGWWCDLGEPENHPADMQHELGPAKSVHNIYSLLWAKMLDKKYTENYPNERLFNLIRSGYAGMQHYSTFPWSGDIQRSFEGLRAQIPVMLGAGMSGLGYMHSDVGGFTGNDNDSELFTRWVQFGVFAPILRLHGTGTTEPINFPEPYKSIMRDYIKLRYKMLPYNYTLAYENSMYGTPFARQLNYYEPQNAALTNINDSYLWGKDFLIAPVLERSVSQRSVQFPEGKWLNYHSLEEYEGHTSYNVNFSIENIPVFVRAGSLIPTVNNLKTTAEYTTDSLCIQYFPDTDQEDSYGYLFADNGKTPGTPAAEEYELLYFTASHTNDEMSISYTKSTESYTEAPQTRNMNLQVFRIKAKPENVSIDANEIPEVSSLDAFSYTNPGYYWDSVSEILYVNCTWNGNKKTIHIKEGSISSVPTADKQNKAFYLHNVSPNPFSERLTVTADIFEPGPYTFEIKTLTGRTAEQFQTHFTNKGRQSLTKDFSSLSPGIYILTMQGKSAKQVRRIIKQ